MKKRSERYSEKARSKYQPEENVTWVQLLDVQNSEKSTAIKFKNELLS